MNYDLCSGTCLKKSGIYSVAMFHKNNHTCRVWLFLWYPGEFEMLGGSEFRLRRGFACGKTLARRKSAAGQKAG